MKITELIDELQEALQEHGDIEVMSSSNYGDYHRTEQLDDIEEITVCQPVESAYSNSGLAFPRGMDEDEDDEDVDSEYNRNQRFGEQVLVLRYTSR